MQNQQPQESHDQYHNDEIDLADLVRSLWNGKWLVIGVTFLTTLLAVAYLTLVPKIYTGTLEISVLPSAKTDVYAEFNTTDLLATNGDDLLALFIEGVKSYDEFEHFIKHYQYIEQLPEETDIEFSFRVRQTAYGFSLTPPTAKDDKNYQPNWLLHIETTSVEQANKLVASALGRANENANAELVTKFDRNIGTKSREIKIALEELDFQRLRAISQYEMAVTAKVELLREQSQIARSLDISNGSLSAQSYGDSTAVVTSIAGDQPLYLRGHVSLEKEVSMLLARENIIPFAPELAKIALQKQAILQDQTIPRARELLANTPIGSADFQAAVYDLAAIEYKSKTKSMLVMALAVVLGGMLGIFILLIRNALVRKS